MNVCRIQNTPVLYKKSHQSQKTTIFIIVALLSTKIGKIKFIPLKYENLKECNQ